MVETALTYVPWVERDEIEAGFDQHLQIKFEEAAFEAPSSLDVVWRASMIGMV